jgi:ATP-dependent Lon protease
VRTLERELGKLCRSKAVEYSTSRADATKAYNPSISADDVSRILGLAKFDQDWREESYRPGVVT